MIQQIAVLLLLAAVPSRAQMAGLVRIGNAAAVRGGVMAFQPSRGAVGVVLDNGKPVYLNDVITTDKSGHLQILLRDETIFTLGPDSSMTLDKFVYDPSTNVGELTANVAKGAFRFISGKIAKKQPSNMKVKLPVGTIGIEGTMVEGTTGPQGSMIVLLGPGKNNNAAETHGQIWVENKGAKVRITRSGYATWVFPDQAPSFPFLASDQMRAEMRDILSPRPAESAPGTTSAAPSKPAAASEKAPDQESGLAKANVPITDAAAAAVINTVSAAAVTASQDTALPDGKSSWDQVRQVTSGVSTFAGTGAFSTGAPGTDTWDYNMTVDFGNRNITGAAKLTIGGSFVDPASTGGIPFGTGSDPSQQSFWFGDPSTTYYGFHFRNAGGIPAKQLVGDVYSIRGTGDEITTTR